MRIGIDVGGTHTDGVLVDGAKLISAAKFPTHHHDLLHSITSVLSAILKDHNPSQVSRLNLSTTLTTNAIITGTLDEVGMFVVGGPGIRPETYCIGNHYHVIPGSLDHRGTVTTELDTEVLDNAISDAFTSGAQTCGVVAKFSPKNPAFEKQICRHIDDRADFISTGHQLSGQLNFGRRIFTTYYNSAVWRPFANFAAALVKSLEQLSISAEVNILKADGGTLALDQTRELPVQSIFSGPAASVMGILAAEAPEADSLMLDIGGTTSDLALFATGAPLLEKEGIMIQGHPTLVRAIQVASVGVGGDSAIRVRSGAVRIGPDRIGPCMACGGPSPSLMDAMNLLGHATFGDTEKSTQGLEELAAENNLSARDLAQLSVDRALTTIEETINTLIKQVNSKPLYTIHEILQERRIEPEQLLVIGGPANAFCDLLSKRLSYKVSSPSLPGVANAIGAALTRPTMQLSLHADTAKGVLSVPTLDIFRPISRKYSLEEAVDELTSLMQQQLEQSGRPTSRDEIHIIQSDAFTMIEGSYNSGEIIRVVAQLQPSVTSKLDSIDQETSCIYG